MHSNSNILPLVESWIRDQHFWCILAPLLLYLTAMTSFCSETRLAVSGTLVQTAKQLQPIKLFHDELFKNLNKTYYSVTKHRNAHTALLVDANAHWTNRRFLNISCLFS